MSIYNNSLPSLDSLKQRDQILFGDKITSQSPDIQKLYSQNVATPYYVNGVLKGIDINKPYILPTTSFIPQPPASDSRYWLSNPDREDPSTYVPPVTGTSASSGTSNDYYRQLLDSFLNPSATSANPEYISEQTRRNQLLADQQAALAAEAAAAEASTRSEYAGIKQGARDTGGRTAGTLQRILGRAGGFTTTSGGVAVATQETALENEINRLSQAESQAVSNIKAQLAKGKAINVQANYDALQTIQKDLAAAKDKQLTSMLDIMGKMDTAKQTATTNKLAQDQFDFEQFKFANPNAITTDTTEIKNYNFYKKQEADANRTPLDFDTWYSNAKAPAAVKEFLAAQKAGFTGSIVDYQISKKGGTGAALDADTMQYFAEKYLTDGVMPSFGMGVAGMTQRAAFYKQVASVAKGQGKTGAESAAAIAGTKAAQAALTLQQKLLSTTQSAEQTALKNAELAYNYGKTFSRPTNLNIVNKWKQWIGLQISDKNLSQFELALFTAAREYAKVSSGAAGSVAGLTDSAMKEAEKLLNSAMTQEQLRSTIDAMKADMTNVTGSMNDTIINLKDQISNTGNENNGSNLTVGQVKDNLNGTYTYKNQDGTIHTGSYGDNYKDNTIPGSGGGSEDPLNLGFSSVGGDTNKAVGMRTDRHNNPTAFTTDIAKLAGLEEGVDYTIGDSFSNGQYHTAKLLGNPIDTTIAVIDKIGFQTSSGKPRWSYINMSKSSWDKLSYQGKKNVIALMYRNEGGSGLSNLFA